MAFEWEELPNDTTSLILTHLGKSLLGYRGPPGKFPNLSDSRDGHAHILKRACMNKSFATSLQPILDIHSTPWKEGHAKRLVAGVLKFVLGPHTVETNGKITSDHYSFLYTQVFRGCGFKSGIRCASHRAAYYRLLPRMLTDLLRARVLPWKGLEAVQKQLCILTHIFKNVGVLVTKYNFLDPVQVCLERAYLEGNPDKTTDPVYYDPLSKKKNGQVSNTGNPH